MGLNVAWKCFCKSVPETLDRWMSYTLYLLRVVISNFLNLNVRLIVYHWYNIPLNRFFFFLSIFYSEYHVFFILSLFSLSVSSPLFFSSFSFVYVYVVYVRLCICYFLNAVSYRFESRCFYKFVINNYWLICEYKFYTLLSSITYE